MSVFQPSGVVMIHARMIGPSGSRRPCPMLNPPCSFSIPGKTGNVKNNRPAERASHASRSPRFVSHPFHILHSIHSPNATPFCKSEFRCAMEYITWYNFNRQPSRDHPLLSFSPSLDPKKTPSLKSCIGRFQNENLIRTIFPPPSNSDE